MASSVKSWLGWLTSYLAELTGPVRQKEVSKAGNRVWSTINHTKRILEIRFEKVPLGIIQSGAKIIAVIKESSIYCGHIFETSRLNIEHY